MVFFNQCRSRNPDEAIYCMKCGGSLPILPGEDKVMSKLSSLETRFIRNLSKEKCQRYRFPAIVLTLISAGMMLLLLFVVEVELADGPGAIVEIDTQGTCTTSFHTWVPNRRWPKGP